MDARVKEFLDAAKAAERKKFEDERDAHLISLGLVDPEKTRLEYSKLDYYTYHYPEWDDELKKYYRVVKMPVEVTDEEYEAIKQASQEPTSVKLEKLSNGAEKFLGVINTIVLIIYILAAVILSMMTLSEKNALFLLAGLCTLIIGLISWAIVKVMLNVSNNLHQINSKLK